MKYLKVKLSDIATIKGGKRMPKGYRLQSEKNNHPYLKIKDLHGMNFEQNSLEYVPDVVFPKIKNYIVNSGNIFLSIVGTIGLVAKIPVELDGASLTENAVKIIPKSSVNTDYLLYRLSSVKGQDSINSVSVGSTQKKLPIKNIKNIVVDLPDITIQNKIARNIGLLDRKLSLNKQINDNLAA